MAYAPFSNNYVQMAQEGTPGTSVPALHVWRGAFSMLEDSRTRVIVDEQIGTLFQPERSYDSMLMATWNQPDTPLTFEQILHILEAGVKTVTPTGAGPYVYAYTMPVTGSFNTTKTYTIETGNVTVAGDQYEMAYGFVESFKLSGNPGETWMMGSVWKGRQMVQAAKTGSLTVPTVNEAPFAYTKLYIDATGGTIGTTQKTGVLMGAEVNVTTGLKAVPVGDGNLYFAATKWTKPEVTFSLTIELEDSSVAATERGFYRSNTTRLIRLLCERSANLKLQIDLAARYDSISDYSNTDGNTTLTLNGHATLSSADSLSASFTITNNLPTAVTVA
jgi:hypothetical protein